MMVGSWGEGRKVCPPPCTLPSRDVRTSSTMPRPMTMARIAPAMAASTLITGLIHRVQISASVILRSPDPAGRRLPVALARRTAP